VTDNPRVRVRRSDGSPVQPRSSTTQSDFRPTLFDEGSNGQGRRDDTASDTETGTETPDRPARTRARTPRKAATKGVEQPTDTSAAVKPSRSRKSRSSAAPVAASAAAETVTAPAEQPAASLAAPETYLPEPQAAPEPQATTPTSDGWGPAASYSAASRPEPRYGERVYAPSPWSEPAPGSADPVPSAYSEPSWNDRTDSSAGYDPVVSQPVNPYGETAYPGTAWARTTDSPSSSPWSSTPVTEDPWAPSPSAAPPEPAVASPLASAAPLVEAPAETVQPPESGRLSRSRRRRGAEADQTSEVSAAPAIHPDAPAGGLDATSSFPAVSFPGVAGPAAAAVAASGAAALAAAPAAARVGSTVPLVGTLPGFEVSSDGAEESTDERQELRRGTLAELRRRRARRVRIRARATVRHVSVWTVFKVSFVFYLVVLAAFVVASVFLWEAASAFGTLPSIEKSVKTLFSLKTFKVHVGTVATYTAGIGLVIAVAGTLANTLLALTYNLIADTIGGVRVDLESVTRD
jgi:hypothetical protein